MRVIVFCPDFPSLEGIIITRNGVFFSKEAGELNFVLSIHRQNWLIEASGTNIWEVDFPLETLLQMIQNPQAFLA